MEENVLQIDTSGITLQLAEIKEAMIQTAAEIAEVFAGMAVTMTGTFKTAFDDMQTMLEGAFNQMAVLLLTGFAAMNSQLEEISNGLGTSLYDHISMFIDVVGLLDTVIKGNLFSTTSGLVSAMEGGAAATDAWSAICTVATAVADNFSAAMSFLAANPIILVIAGIAALVVGIVCLIKNWDVVSAKALEVWEKIKAVWEPFAKWFDKSVWEPFKNIMKGVGNFFIGVWNGMIGAAETAVNWIIGGINSMISSINRLLRGASDLLDRAGISVNFKVDRLDKVSFGRVPALASGGLAYGKTLAVIGDNPNAAADPEVIAPLSKLENMILSDNDRVVEAIYLLINTMENKSFDIALDGDSLAEKLESRREKVKARRGRQAIVCG